MNIFAGKDMFVNMPDFSKSNVLVIGDIFLDRYWYGETEKISPEAPVPVVKIKKLKEVPGGGANVAVNISALGGKSILLGLTGLDEASCILKKKLTAANVIFHLLPISTHSTIVKLRIVSSNQQLIRLDFENNFNNVNLTKLLKKIELYMPQCKILVLSDYLKGSLYCIEEIIQLAHSFNIPVIIDPKGNKFERYRGATVLTPNMLEFESVVGNCYSDIDLMNRAQDVLYDYNISALLITRSEKGMTLFKRDRKKKLLHFKSQAKVIYDVTGAGDTVVGVLAASLSSGKNLEDSCFLANLAAGIVVGKFGTSSVKIHEIKDVLYHDLYKKIPLGILEENQLREIISVVRFQGEKIVMTNGIFDILHAGHVSYLKDAKKLGDRLIVAVNSDDSTRRLKGLGRPINTLKKRMLVLSSLSMVDWVVPFYEDTPKRLVMNLSPDFLVKGGDYRISSISGSKEVLKNNGKVCVLDFRAGCSTSEIINRYQNIIHNLD